MTCIYNICADSMNEFQSYLNKNISGLPRNFVDNCVTSFAIGATVSFLASGLNPAAALCGGTLSVVASCVNVAFLKGIKSFQDTWCDHFNKPRRSLTDEDRVVSWASSIAFTTLGACALDLPVSIPLTIITNIFFAVW